MDVDYNPSRRYLIKNKWVATAASIWIQSTSGSIYTFSVYSSILKSTQNYSQSTLGTISVFKDLGSNVGILSGLLYSAAAAPWVVILAGAVQSFLGYFLMWLTVVGELPNPPAAVMCIYMLVAANSMTFFNTADVVTGVHNFPNYRGVIVGIMKGFLGLSGAILIQVYQTIFKSHPSSYLLLLALLPSLNAVILMRFVRTFETNEEDEKKYLNRFSFFAVLLAGYLTAVIIIQHLVKLKLWVRIFSFVLLVLLVVFPIIVAVEAQRQKGYRLVKSLLEQNQIGFVSPLIDDAGPSTRPQDHSDTDDVSDWRDEWTLIESMRSMNFWLLFYTTGCAMGSGLATVNNLSQIGESLGYTSLETNTLVSLWSIWNFLGRFGAGYVSDSLLHIKGYPRPVFIVITLASMSIGHGIIASGIQGSLYVGSVLVGVCYGSQWSLMPTVASEVFGKAHMGTIFNTITIAGPIGSYLLSVRIVGYIYDKEAARAGGSDHGEVSCIGTRCFMLSFMIMATVTFSGFVVALVLLIRTRKVYNNLWLGRSWGILEEG